LNDAQWARIEGFLSLKRKGAHRVDDRRVIRARPQYVMCLLIFI